MSLAIREGIKRVTESAVTEEALTEEALTGSGRSERAAGRIEAPFATVVTASSRFACFFLGGSMTSTDASDAPSQSAGPCSSAVTEKALFPRQATDLPPRESPILPMAGGPEIQDVVFGVHGVLVGGVRLVVSRAHRAYNDCASWAWARALAASASRSPFTALFLGALGAAATTGFSAFGAAGAAAGFGAGGAALATSLFAGGAANATGAVRGFADMTGMSASDTVGGITAEGAGRTTAGDVTVIGAIGA